MRFILVFSYRQLAVVFACIVFLFFALSFMPGGLGGAEAVMVALLMWKGVPSADAIAATVLIRLTTLWFAVGIGAVCMGIQRRASLL